MALFYTERILLHTRELFADKRVRRYSSPEKMALFGNKMICEQHTLKEIKLINETCSLYRLRC